MTRPQLTLRSEFEEALKQFHMSDHALNVLKNAPLLAFMGMSASGRNTVIRRLIKTGQYEFVVSDTTRSPKVRDGKKEQHGVDYFFRTEQEVLDDIRSGEFIEAEIIHNQQVSGSSIRELQRVVEMNKIPIRDFEYGGAMAIMAAKPDVTLVALLPPTFDEWLRRLHLREKMSDDEFMNRLTTAREVLKYVLDEKRIQVVINDDIDRCVQEIDDLVRNPRDRTQNQIDARDIATRLLSRVEKELSATS